MKLEIGKTYYFWNSQIDRLGQITITEISSDGFKGVDKINRKRIKGNMDLADMLYPSKKQVPEFCERMKGINFDEDRQRGNADDILVGYEHHAPGSDGKIFHSIFYDQGANDRISQRSVYDTQEYYDYYDD